MKTLSLALLTLMTATTAYAQKSVDERREVFPDAVIEISNIAGKVTVVGTSAAELHVTGTIASSHKLEITGKDGRIKVEVVYPKQSSGDATIQVQVPNGSTVSVSTISADIDMRDLKRPCKAVSVSGNIDIIEGIDQAQANSVSGDIDIRSKTSLIQVETVSGDITVYDASKHIRATSVSGSMEITASTVTGVLLSSVSGNIIFKVSGSIAATGRIDVKNHSGDVIMTLPSNSDPDIQVQTLSGSRLRNDFGRKSRNGAKQGPEVRIEAFSGNITIASS